MNSKICHKNEIVVLLSNFPLYDNYYQPPDKNISIKYILHLFSFYLLLVSTPRKLDNKYLDGMACDIVHYLVAAHDNVL